MATKPRLHKYWIRGVKKARGKTILARNEQDALNKVARMFPKASLVGVERLPSKTGREFETLWLDR